MFSEEYRYEPENMRRIAIIRRGRHEVRLVLRDRDVAMGSRFMIHDAIQEITKREQQDYYEQGLSQYGTILGL